MTNPHLSRGAGARWTDQQVEQFIGNLLRTGVVAAAVVGVAGGALYLAHHGFEPVDYRAFRGAPQELRAVGGIAAGALSLRSMAIVQLGLLLLIVTPIARVTCALGAFILQRDRAYVVITTIVLALLLLSLSGAAPV